jgi:hypothetical protein
MARAARCPLPAGGWRLAWIAIAGPLLLQGSTSIYDGIIT